MGRTHELQGVLQIAARALPFEVGPCIGCEGLHVPGVLRDSPRGMTYELQGVVQDAARALPFELGTQMRPVLFGG